MALLCTDGVQSSLCYFPKMETEASRGFSKAKWFMAPDVLRGRVASRTGDASDADVAVLEAQLDRDAGEIGWERLDAEAPLRED